MATSTSMTGLLARLLPKSLRARIMLAMVLGVGASQLLAMGLWAFQLHQIAGREAAQAAQHIASGAGGALRFFRDLPPRYRPLLLEQMRTMGGTRFFVSINRFPVPVKALPRSRLTGIVTDEVLRSLRKDQAGLLGAEAAFCWPDELAVTDNGGMLRDMPERWVDGATLLLPRPAPLLVLQLEFEPGGWLMLVTTMPDPYFLETANPLTIDRWLPQAGTLLTVLLLVLIVARSLTRPLQRLARAARAFGQGLTPDAVPETGTVELRETARAFNDMQSRIQAFIDDRERLFRSISHDLKTPLMRLRLRTELLGDEHTAAEFNEDLDELDMMVKSALQSVRDTDIHENETDVRLDRLLDSLASPAIANGRAIEVDVPPISVRGRPLALKRALGNLLDNAQRYARHVVVTAERAGDEVRVLIRDDGPGLPEEALAEVFEPYVRLDHGRENYAAGSGLGLGIAREIVRAHGGRIGLANVGGGGLMVSVDLPAAKSGA